MQLLSYPAFFEYCHIVCYQIKFQVQYLGNQVTVAQWHNFRQCGGNYCNTIFQLNPIARIANDREDELLVEEYQEAFAQRRITLHCIAAMVGVITTMVTCLQFISLN